MPATKNSGSAKSKALASRKPSMKTPTNTRTSIRNLRRQQGADAVVLPSKKVIRRRVFKNTPPLKPSIAGLPAPRSSLVSTTTVSAATCEHKQTTLSNQVLQHEEKPVVMLLRTCDACGHIVQNLVTEITSAKSTTSTSEIGDPIQPKEQATQLPLDANSQAAQEWASMPSCATHQLRIITPIKKGHTPIRNEPSHFQRRYTPFNSLRPVMTLIPSATKPDLHDVHLILPV